TLECWGSNYSGMFGDGTVNPSITTVTAAGGATYASFVAHRLGTCALASDGRAQCWCRGGDGSVGNGALQAALSPAAGSGGPRLAHARPCATIRSTRPFCNRSRPKSGTPPVGPAPLSSSVQLVISAK